MNQDALTPGFESHDMSDFMNFRLLRSASQTNSAHQLMDPDLSNPSLSEDDNDRSRPQSPLSTYGRPLLQSEQIAYGQSPIAPQSSQQKDLRDFADKRSRWILLLYCLPHMLPLSVTITILSLNAFGVYWQDLGRPNQNTVLQALQYVAKAHEVTMAASLTAMVVHQTHLDLKGPNGIPLGFLTAGFQLGDPLFVCTKEFFGGSMARVHSRRASRFSVLVYLLILGFALTLVVGPSSAVAMIPRLDWWDVSKVNAFGPEYTDRVYFNRTEAELWPVTITNAIYADLSMCISGDADPQDCAVGAAEVVGTWVSQHQSQGTEPNITVFQDSEVSRYLTAQGGPPDNSSFTVSSTAGSVFAKDFDHYWDWVVENSSLPMNIDRPLLRPAFKNPSMKMRKPLVQAQCRTYFNPDWELDAFEFPHDELVTPPLDEFINDTWRLPNDFVLNLKGKDRIIGNVNDTTHPWILFEWYDTVSNFSSIGAPSLGAVMLYLAYNGSNLVDALSTCSFDGRWAPVEYYLDPKDSITLHQDSPNPMEILKGTSKEPTKDLIQMKMSMNWANTINTQGSSPEDQSATVVEQILEGFRGEQDFYSFIFAEPEKTLGYVMKSIDWRLSTALGLYLTESLARAFSDSSKGSMLYRQAPEANQSYVRYLNDINQPTFKEGYKNGKLDWVEMRDPQWNSSIPSWDVWAPQNGYTEITFTVQRNGYGYGFDGVPIKLATTVLALYVMLVCGHTISVLVGGGVYKGYLSMSNMMALAWSSIPTTEMSDIVAGVERYRSWSRVVRATEEQQRLQLVVLDDMEEVVRR